MDDVLEFTKSLVGMDTVSNRSTRSIADFLSNVLEDSGFVIEQQVYRNAGVEKVNVVARKGGTEPKLALSGHLDTVPFDEGDWLTDPLELTERDGRFYGMGVCDMKGFLAVVMCAGMRIAVADLRYPFALVFTSDEEIGCVGAKQLIRKKERLAEMIIIGEPTEFKPVFLHKGYIFLQVILRGRRGHSSRPAEGENVIERALPTVIHRLTEFKQAMERARDERLNPPYPTLNVGKVDTGPGSSKNIIADYCAIDIDIRPIPGQDIEEIMRSLQQHVAPTGVINGIKVAVRFARAPTPPFLIDPGTPLVQEAVRMTEQFAVSTSFNTEAGVFSNKDTQVVVCGLGSIKQAHRPNEFLDARYLQDTMVDHYEALIRRLCGKQ